jgi:hypothetical protein
MKTILSCIAAVAIVTAAHAQTTSGTGSAPTPTPTPTPAPSPVSFPYGVNPARFLPSMTPVATTIESINQTDAATMDMIARVYAMQMARFADESATGGQTTEQKMALMSRDAQVWKVALLWQLNAILDPTGTNPAIPKPPITVVTGS